MNQGLIVVEFRSIGIRGRTRSSNVRSTPADVGLFQFRDPNYGVGHVVVWVRVKGEAAPLRRTKGIFFRAIATRRAKKCVLSYTFFKCGGFRSYTFEKCGGFRSRLPHRGRYPITT
jgi:hypothetical protein